MNITSFNFDNIPYLNVLGKLGKEGLFLLSIIFGYAVLKLITELILKSFKKFFKLINQELGNRIVEIIEKKTNALVIVLVLYISIYFFYGNVLLLGKTLYEWFIIALLIIVGIIVADIIKELIEFYIIYIAPKTESTIDDEILPLTKNLIIIFYYVVLISIILSQFGIDIAPLVASLGIAGLAVGLALQDSLSNLFAGMHLIAERPIKVGDIIELANKKVVGRVAELSWRTTRLIAYGNKLIIIPNKELANSTIINYTALNKPFGEIITLNVAYGTDLNKVYKVLERIMQKLVKEGLIMNEGDYKYFYKLNNLNQYSLDIVAVFFVDEYSKRYQAKRMFLELVYNEFNKEGIEIPFPTSTIYLKQDEKNTNKKRRKKKK